VLIPYENNTFSWCQSPLSEIKMVGAKKKENNQTYELRKIA
jgi:hypothetical protein